MRKQAGIPKLFEPLILIEKLREFQPSPAELLELEKQFYYGNRSSLDEE